MLRAFGWTALFWSLFTFVNGVSDAILFYSVFPWYQDMTTWHWLKAAWILFAVLTGVFAIRLWMHVKYDIFRAKPAPISHPYSGVLSFELHSGKDKIYRKKKEYRLKATLIFIFLLAWFLFLRWQFHETFMEIWRTP